MILAVLVDRIERGIGEGRPRAEEGVDVVARMGDVERRLDDEVHQIRQTDVDDFGAGRLDRGDCRAHDLVDLGAVGIVVAAEGFLEDADARALQAFGVEAVGVAALVAGDGKAVV